MGKFSPKEQYYPATAPFNYRYPIRAPSRARIALIAAHKRNLVQATVAASTVAASATDNNSSNNSSSNGISNNSNSINTNSPRNNNAPSPANTSLKTSSSVDQLLAKPNIQDDLRRELDDLNKYSELIKKDIKTLSNIRGNVLWMLKKVTHANTLKNHRGENVVKVQVSNNK